MTISVDAPVNAENFEQALEAAKKKDWLKLVKKAPGCDYNDWQVQLYQVWDTSANGEM